MRENWKWMFPKKERERKILMPILYRSTFCSMTTFLWFLFSLVPRLSPEPHTTYWTYLHISSFRSLPPFSSVCPDDNAIYFFWKNYTYTVYWKIQRITFVDSEHKKRWYEYSLCHSLFFNKYLLLWLWWWHCKWLMCNISTLNTPGFVFIKLLRIRCEVALQ